MKQMNLLQDEDSQTQNNFIATIKEGKRDKFRESLRLKDHILLYAK